MLKILVLTIATIGLSACSVSLTREGRMVRKIQPDWANQCKFLGTSESSNGSGFMVKDDIKNAKTEMKNDVAIQGGNAYVITGQYTDGFGTTFEYEIFRCKEK